MDIVSITEGRSRQGLRLITRKGVPTPWAQAAKGLIELKGLNCVLVQESSADPKGAQVEWVGDAGAPFLVYDEEPARNGWADILELLEQVKPAPALVPEGTQRPVMYGLANEICGPMGLGWCLRLLMVDRSLKEPGGEGTFPERIAQYLSRKYGYRESSVSAAPCRVSNILEMLAEQLGQQRYFFGDRISALDVYWAAFGNMFLLLDETELPALPMVRTAWAGGGGSFKNEVAENLRQLHRRMWVEHLGLPVQL